MRKRCEGREASDDAAVPSPGVLPTDSQRIHALSVPHPDALAPHQLPGSPACFASAGADVSRRSGHGIAVRCGRRMARLTQSQGTPSGLRMGILLRGRICSSIDPRDNPTAKSPGAATSRRRCCAVSAFPISASTRARAIAGLHDSLVNHLGNTEPGILLCLHEDHSVAIAHGYAKATGEPMACVLHSNVGLLHGMMSLFNAWCDRAPMFVLGATGPVDAEKRRPWIDWIHTSRDQGGLRPLVHQMGRPADLAGRRWSNRCAAPISPRAPRRPRRSISASMPACRSSGSTRSRNGPT